MTVRILGLATATPSHSIPQPDAAAMAAAICGAPDEQVRAVAALYRRSTVRRRASVVLSNGLPNGAVRQSFFPAAVSGSDRGPSTAARLERYAVEAPALAAEASIGALSEAGVAAGEVTHLVTVSCTGFGAPGVDVCLIARLALPATALRTNVGFMGCHGAINGLRVARAFAADPAARVLLCAVELCSLHFHYTNDPEKIVANALFADGAGAAVIGSQPRSGAAAVAASGSYLFHESMEAMTWRIGDHGFEMTLSPRVPDLLGSHLRPWMTAFLGSVGLAIGDVAGWAVHPGGPRILSSVAECLGVGDSALAASRAVLADHGNMSSPTVLFILDRLRGAHGGRLPTPCVALAFGPGLVAEAALLL